jgi:hypothetical protein
VEGIPRQPIGVPWGRRRDGWVNGPSLEDLPGHLAGLRQAANQVERPAYLGRLEINYMPISDELDIGTAKRYADLGVDRLLSQHTGLTKSSLS